MVRPWRISFLSTRAYRAQSPKHRAVDGKYGTGATTTLSTSPLATRWRNLFSTNTPWLGCSEFGNSVVKVSTLSGRRLSDAEHIARTGDLQKSTLTRPPNWQSAYSSERIRAYCSGSETGSNRNNRRETAISPGSPASRYREAK